MPRTAGQATVRNLRAGQAPPHRECGVEPGNRYHGVSVVERALGLGHGVFEPLGVHLFRGNIEEVAGPARDDDVRLGVQEPPQLADPYVQHLDCSARGAVVPQRLDQPLHRDCAAWARQEGG